MTEREKFEGWYLDRFAREPMPSGYESGIAWEAWQAARAASPKVPQDDHIMDAMIYGSGFMQDGERVDPAKVYKQALPQGVEEWIASGKDYDRNIHSNPDAQAWAEFFMETFPNCGANPETIHGWFANAMMAMHDYLISGMALVPADEITPEMWSAGRNEFCRIYDRVKYAMHSEIESAEIDAAPQSMMTAMLAATKEKGE